MPTTYTSEAVKACNIGVDSFVADELVATIDYEAAVPWEFLIHAYKAGMVIVEDSVEAPPPYIRICKARSAMPFHNSTVAANATLCAVTTDENIPIDVLVLMHERGLLKV
jgi:hypothetical protein